jgi:hypothetical protein
MAHPRRGTSAHRIAEPDDKPSPNPLPPLRREAPAIRGTTDVRWLRMRHRLTDADGIASPLWRGTSCVVAGCVHHQLRYDHREHRSPAAGASHDPCTQPLQRGTQRGRNFSGGSGQEETCDDAKRKVNGDDGKDRDAEGARSDAVLRGARLWSGPALHLWRADRRGDVHGPREPAVRPIHRGQLRPAWPFA